MSYCVNCGVELSDSEKRCPLCNTPVINPNTFGLVKTNPEIKSYEHVSHLKIDFKVISGIISILLIIPVCVSVICDVVTSSHLTWSLYVIGAIILTFIICLLPAFIKKKNPYLLILMDGTATFAYLCLINRLCGGNWAFSLCLPICIISCIFAMFFTLTVRNKRVSKLLKISIYVLFTGIYSLAIEICINDWQGAQLHLDWAHFVLIPCACIAAVVVFIDSQKKLKEEIRKKMFM